ncbi:unnamed protein product [Closterium sp. NIES-65]|nr:unnamed protein product [Closterium sp. NIES-65]
MAAVPAFRVAASFRPLSTAAAPSTLSSGKSTSFGCASSLCPCTPSAAFRATKGRQTVVTPRADLDNDTLVGIGVGLAGIAVGIGIPVFYEIAVKGSEKRENDQPCFPCKGTGARKSLSLPPTAHSVTLRRNSTMPVRSAFALSPTPVLSFSRSAFLSRPSVSPTQQLRLAESCRFCQGTGVVVVELGGGEREESECINCTGKGAITCTTCQGTGVQPRYLDRREFKDDD